MQCAYCAAQLRDIRQVIHVVWSFDALEGTWTSHGKILAEVQYRCVEGHNFQITNEHGGPAVLPVLPKELFLTEGGV